VAPVAPAAGAPVLSVSVQGNALVDGSGAHIRLLGVNRSGAEFACAQGWGIFDGPTDAASIAAMKSWHINTVRVPLNEDCWLGINGVNPAYGGANYRSAIGSYVTALHNAGLLVILDLHWNAPGATLATGQQVMADALMRGCYQVLSLMGPYLRGDTHALFRKLVDEYSGRPLEKSTS